MSSPDDVAANVADWTRRNAEWTDGSTAAARLAKLGARVVGVDPTPAQLVLSEHRAATWADTARWLPEAARER